MTDRFSHPLAWLLVATLAVLPGCDGTTDPAPAEAASGHFTGRITSADGSPITLPGVERHVLDATDHDFMGRGVNAERYASTMKG